MKHTILLTILVFFGFMSLVEAQQETISQTELHEGFFDFEWEAQTGKIHLKIDKLNQEFLYINSLAAGIGSNDIGLDRGQLGSTRIVKFERSGNKILMIQPNYRYRAVSENILEKAAVEQAFAQSVIWGFTIASEGDGVITVDATDFFLRDAHGVVRRLTSEGTYRLDKTRSAMYLPRTRNFPENSEFEATLTFTGNARGAWIRSVAPNASAVTVRQHHSFVQLPDGGYEPRIHDPRCGYGANTYFDYATPIEESLTKRFIRRHRLQKKNPNVARSEPVEPIIYYLDPGCPEPIASALIEGASWWNQAFEAAGYINAFQVKVLPPDADPLDVRYNMIQWVHRSTRGWSYGSSVSDPRTGEIIKGHVSLGSLRVRQDFLIAQGLLSVFEGDTDDSDPMLKLALARLRQLSAHEVGHTIGISHNFASSFNNRASVMDYPHPLVSEGPNGLDLDQAYDVGIGEWDKRVILYGYEDYPTDQDEDASLMNLLLENEKMGLKYITDSDSRPPSGAHPHAHLWDNGPSAADELNRLATLRADAMERFGLNSIRVGTPTGYLENVFVPLYLAHRYQVEAVSKSIGGVNYQYAVKGSLDTEVSPVTAKDQRKALGALQNTLEPEFLAIPEHIIKLIPPQPPGYGRGREMFKIYTGLTFDPLAAAESSANHTIRFLLNPARLARLIQQGAMDAGQLDAFELIDKLGHQASENAARPGLEGALGQIVEKLLVQHLIQVAANKSINPQVSAIAQHHLEKYSNTASSGIGNNHSAHLAYIYHQVTLFMQDPSSVELPKPFAMPDGSPIGCGYSSY